MDQSYGIGVICSLFSTTSSLAYGINACNDTGGERWDRLCFLGHGLEVAGVCALALMELISAAGKSKSCPVALQFLPDDEDENGVSPLSSRRRHKPTDPWVAYASNGVCPAADTLLECSG
ncbi:hypothetical protein HGRIS_014503 [Hohenbuehelia grisea]|uniref:Uncharacterized protein n=1 Tax=Hohenbuehelia grisea TaxID=104357 RepID=A0ABR3JUM5_9AGAR